VQGNVIGLSVAGTPRGNKNGVDVFGPGSTIGGSAPGARNVIAGNESSGVSLFGGPNVVQGNYIGSDATGMLSRGNDFAGVAVFGDGNVIGGSGAGEGNLISGSTLSGVTISFGDSTRVQGNLIGTDATGTAALGEPQGIGIQLTRDANTSNTLIGGTAAGQANVIAFNGTGISLADNSMTATSMGTTIRGNSIFSTVTGPAIDLKADGAVTPNDPLDADTGVNGLQNFPVLTGATTTTVTGTLNSLTGQSGYTVDLYAGPACSALGNGEGKTYLGSVANLTTNPSGDVAFAFTPASALTPGQAITATATDSAGNTSEFSACRIVPQPQQPPPPTTKLAKLKLKVPAQRLIKQKGIVLTLASDVNARFTATGTVNVPQLGARVFKLTRRTGSLKGGARAKRVTLRAGKKLISRAKAAFKRHRKLKASVTVLLSDAAGKSKPVKRRFQLKR
jgi:hypothetical protein